MILPAMTEKEQNLLKNFVQGKRSYLEYGCGGSTILAVQLGVHRVVSVESNKDWIEKLKQEQPIKAAIANHRLTFLHIDLGPVTEWGAPADNSRIRNWHRYYREPWATQQSDFEFVLIDGRFRIPCALITVVCAPDEALIAIHDFGFRAFYYRLEMYLDVEERADSLIIARKRKGLNLRALVLDLTEHGLNSA